ncbi:unnamed protein product [Schistocephalus solidus]|uniref:Uncharacterized protein n=1 Tax=Schistocephalus solidus TaxID=70667 RepID=A0A183TI28_SCHSO|nr:unnamed protein product [Schistocephalus solidus]
MHHRTCGYLALDNPGCPPRPIIFKSDGHLRIHRTETGDQCKQHQYAPTAANSTVCTAQTDSRTVWAY